MLFVANPWVISGTSKEDFGYIDVQIQISRYIFGKKRKTVIMAAAVSYAFESRREG